MSIFELVKQRISLQEAAEHYGLAVTYNGMTCCPFHEDRHPSMKLNGDYFYCFGCQERGDVVDFTAKLFGLINYKAAQKLAADFGLDPNPPTSVNMSIKARSKIAQRRNAENECYSLLNEYLCLLRKQKEQYVPDSPESDLDDRYVEACYWLPYAEHLMDEWLAGDNEERTALMESATLARIKRRLALEKKGVERDAKLCLAG